jgi:Protein of unknown function (DUF541)
MIRSMSTRSAVLIPLLVLAVGACTAATPAAPAAPAVTSPAPLDVAGAPAIDLVGPALPPTPVSAGGGSSSAGSSAAGAAIAYPYPILGGSAGVAPDHELVVNGSGQATLKSDLSNEAAAQRTALAAAIADARAQAEAAASDAGVTLGGVVSMSVQVSGIYSGGDYGVMPMGSGGASEVPPSNSTTIAPAPPATVSTPSVPTTQELQVSVTVAYAIS